MPCAFPSLVVIRTPAARIRDAIPHLGSSAGSVVSIDTVSDAVPRRCPPLSGNDRSTVGWQDVGVPNNDPDLIYQSAKLFLGDPLIQMEQAHQLVKERCTLDAHNSIMLLANPKPPALPPLQSHGSPQAGQALFGGAGVAAGTIMALVMRNAMTATMLRAAGELEIMAAAAMVFWVLFMPD